MKVLPVLDLLRGQVVRGIAGRRSEYKPVQSRLCTSAAPEQVAAALAEHFGFREAYVADLDAISGGEPDWSSYERIAGAGLKVWLDAGLSDVSRAASILIFAERTGAVSRLIAGLETLASPQALSEMARHCGRQMVFSLDMKHGVPICGAAWSGMSSEQIADAAVECGVGSVILLDLAQVGTYQGLGTEDLCRVLRRRYPQLELIGGGGVSSAADLERLAEAGFDAVLIASALHDGRLTAADIAAMREAAS